MVLFLYGQWDELMNSHRDWASCLDQIVMGGYLFGLINEGVGLVYLLAFITVRIPVRKIHPLNCTVYHYQVKVRPLAHVHHNLLMFTQDLLTESP